MPDEAALMRQLHDEHAPALWRFCLRLVDNDPGHAEDVVQETLLRAWRHRAVLESRPPAMRAWLFTVARNIVIDEWRSARTRRETPVADVPDDGHDVTDQILLSWVVADAFTRLSPDHRECSSSATTGAGRWRRRRGASGSRRARSSRARTTPCAPSSWPSRRWG